MPVFVLDISHPLLVTDFPFPQPCIGPTLPIGVFAFEGTEFATSIAFPFKQRSFVCLSSIAATG